MENIEAKLCYREYVLQESDSITMEEAERGYEKCILSPSLISSYCRRQQYKNAMAFFDSFANQEWLVESTVPSAHKDYLRAQQAEHAQEAQHLAAAIVSGARRSSSAIIPASKIRIFVPAFLGKGYAAVDKFHSGRYN